MKPLRSTAPAHSILNCAFDYRNAAETDLRLTFARARRAMAQLAKARAEQEAREANHVVQLKRRKA